jgi:hypothetical protein
MDRIKNHQFITLLMVFLALGLFSSCKKCYECSRNHFCTVCVDNTSGLTTTTCSRSFTSDSEYRSARPFTTSTRTCQERGDGTEDKRICNRGLIGKTVLEADKFDLQEQGYFCTLR